MTNKDDNNSRPNDNRRGNVPEDDGRDQQAVPVERAQQPNDPEDPTPNEDPAHVPDETEAPQDDQATLQAIFDEYRKIDRRSIEGKIRQGELLEEAHEVLTDHKAWVKFVTGPLATNLMDAHRKIRCFKAAQKAGANKLLASKLSESAIWHLAAPDVPDEALAEAIELCKTDPITAAQAERLALDSIRGNNKLPRSTKSTKPRPEKIPLEPTPEAIAQYVRKTFTDEEIDRLLEQASERPSEKEDTRTNSAPMNRAVNRVIPASAKKLSAGLSPALGTLLVNDSWVYASDGKIVAATHFPHDGSFLVPGQVFRQAVIGEPDIEIVDDELVVTHLDGSIRRIPTLPTDEFPEFRGPSGDRYSVEWEGRSAIRTLAPFCSEDTSRPEAMGIWLNKGIALVANGKIRLRVKGTRLKPDLFLPIALIKYILSQRAGPIELVLGDGWVWFIWADGSWAGMKQIELKSDQKKILNDALAELRSAAKLNETLSDDWRDAVDKVKGAGAEHILIYKGRLEGTYKSGVPGKNSETCRITIPVKTPVPANLKGECLKVPMRLIEPILSFADAIDFTAYPDAVPFAGEAVDGFVELPKAESE